jgi:hydroxyacylglutathione hydrolase
MLLKNIYDDKLAQASYFIGCQATGEAIVIDPNRDVAQYLRIAAAERMRISQVTETHIHADFVSGARELAATTGAQLLLSDEGDADWKYHFAGEAGARLLKDGDVFMVGNLRFEVMHTPGHTPEHICFIVTDTPATDQPIGALTGDFIFVGDVGRPDLLEKAANMAGTMEAGARTLFRSLQRFRRLPDYLQLWPGHGAGSACGKALGAVPQSTLGYERIANWGLQIDSEEEFIAAVLAGQPEPPKYFGRMKQVNKEGPATLDGFHTPQRLLLPELRERLARGETVVDTRGTAAFAAGHVPGTINVPLGKSFPTYAGWLLSHDRPVTLIVDQERVAEAVRDLALIGFDEVSGWFALDVIEQWRGAGGELGSVPQISAAELAGRMRTEDVTVLDVRGRSEWDAGHVPGVPNVPYGHITERLAEIPRDKPVIVYCETGSRSAIAASLLLARGYEDVVNVRGGFADWERQKLPAERSSDAALITT